ncbi:hypothetical protein NMY22_g16920 [Coprinellus aureogranulatus]|nr:hypothetical protein NMY22_g16920 [Coprinellus aureogranulatus]
MTIAKASHRRRAHQANFQYLLCSGMQGRHSAVAEREAKSQYRTVQAAAGGEFVPVQDNLDTDELKDLGLYQRIPPADLVEVGDCGRSSREHSFSNKARRVSTTLSHSSIVRMHRLFEISVLTAIHERDSPDCSLTSAKQAEEKLSIGLYWYPKGSRSIKARKAREPPRVITVFSSHAVTMAFQPLGHAIAVVQYSQEPSGLGNHGQMLLEEQCATKRSDGSRVISKGECIGCATTKSDGVEPRDISFEVRFPSDSGLP